MSMIDLARKRKDEIMALKNKGLSNAEVASVMRVRGCEISSGTVSTLLHSDDKIEDKSLSEKTLSELLDTLNDFIESGKSKKPGAAVFECEVLKRTLEILVQSNLSER